MSLILGSLLLSFLLVYVTKVSFHSRNILMIHCISPFCNSRHIRMILLIHYIITSVLRKYMWYLGRMAGRQPSSESGIINVLLFGKCIPSCFSCSSSRQSQNYISVNLMRCMSLTICQIHSPPPSLKIG